MKQSQTKHPVSPRRPKRPHADWLSWSLHLLLGLIIGAAAGGGVAMRMVRFNLISVEQMLYIVTGVSLFSSAITSYRGNRVWFPPSVFDAEEPPQSRTSHIYSLAIGGLGVGIILWTVYRHVQADAWHMQIHSFDSLDILILFLVALLVWMVVHALRTGTALGRYGIIDRDESPIAFWLYVALTASSTLYILLSLFR